MRTSKPKYLGKALTLALGLIGTSAIESEAQEIPDSSSNSRLNYGVVAKSYLDEEVVVGGNIYWQFPKDSRFSIGPYFAKNFDSQTTETLDPIVTERESVLIGNHIRKTRTDTEKTTEDISYPYEAGIRGRVELSGKFFLTGGFGFVRSNNNSSTEGTTTIEFERDGHIIDSGTATNEISVQDNGWGNAYSLGVEYRFGFKPTDWLRTDLTAGLFYTQRDGENKFGIEFGAWTWNKE
jgi:hypothetical protein